MLKDLNFRFIIKTRCVYIFQNVYIFRTGEGRYIISDDDSPIHQLLVLATGEVLTDSATDIHYLGKLKGRVDKITNLAETDNRYNRHENRVVVVGPDELREAIKKARSSTLLDEHREYLLHLEESIS